MARPWFNVGATAVIASVFAIGCTGTIDGPVGGGGVAPPPVGGAGGGTVVPPPPGGPQPEARLHKLTASQYANSLHDLLGADVPIAQVDPDQETEGFTAVGASLVSVSPSGVGLYEVAAGAATTWLFADPARLSGALACVPATAADTACASKALSGLGRRAFRRPLTDAETQRFVTVATTIAGSSGGSMAIGMRHAVNAILQSPSFLYRVELGVASAADGGRLKYTSHEMASRLASALWNTVPDTTLLDAADKNGLATTDGVNAQVKRMLADPRAHHGLTAFVDDLFVLRNLQDALPDPAVFPNFTPTLRAAMQKELELRVDDLVLGSRGDFLAMFDSRTTFVNNELAKHYGLPTAASDDFRRVEIPADSARAGLLGSGALLAGLALPQRTAPSRRGKFVREMLLCQTIPPPPDKVPPLTMSLDPTATMRQRLSQHRSDPGCAACHALMDPLGLPMEAFDGVGRFRATENGKPVDTTGELDGVPFDGLAQMGAALRRAAVVGPCFVSKLYTNAQGRAPAERDTAVLNKLAADFAASGHRADQLLLDLLANEAFRFVEPGKL